MELQQGHGRECDRQRAPHRQRHPWMPHLRQLFLQNTTLQAVLGHLRPTWQRSTPDRWAFCSFHAHIRALAFTQARSPSAPCACFLTSRGLSWICAPLRMFPMFFSRPLSHLTPTFRCSFHSPWIAVVRQHPGAGPTGQTRLCRVAP